MGGKKRSNPNLTLGVLSLAGLAYAVLSSAVVPALPTIQHDLHTTETGVTWLLTGYLLAASVGTSIIGRLGDMYGKERLLIYTLILLAFGTLLAAVSTSLGVLILARVIQGAGGGIFPLAFGIVRDEFPRDKVAGSIGLMSAILGVGGGVGIVMSGADRRAPELALALLDPARGDRPGHDLHVALRAGVADPRARPDQLAGGVADERRDGAPPCSRSARRRPGAGARRGRSACSRPGSPCAPLWVAVEVRSRSR